MLAENRNWRYLSLSVLAIGTMCAKHVGSQSPIISLDWISPLHRRHKSREQEDLRLRNENTKDEMTHEELH